MKIIETIDFCTDKAIPVIVIGIDTVKKQMENYALSSKVELLKERMLE